VFYEEHKAEVDALGFNIGDMESRREFYSELFTNADIQIPVKFELPEKPEDWVSFAPPQELEKRGQDHEDKIMVAKWTFVKPELTFHHIMAVAALLEQHYFHV